jgi:hypothetical protein
MVKKKETTKFTVTRRTPAPTLCTVGGSEQICKASPPPSRRQLPSHNQMPTISEVRALIRNALQPAIVPARRHIIRVGIRHIRIEGKGLTFLIQPRIPLLIIEGRAGGAAILEAVGDQRGEIVADVVDATLEDVGVGFGGGDGLAVEAGTVERDAEDLFGQCDGVVCVGGRYGCLRCGRWFHDEDCCCRRGG